MTLPVLSEPTVIHETPTWLVLDKPAGWHTVRGKTEAGEGGGGVLESWLAETRPELKHLPESGLVHRLDRDTSGVIVIAKTPRAHRTLSKHFRERWVKKFYLALVSGRVEQNTGEIDAPIGSKEGKDVWPRWQIMDEKDGGKPAKTLYKVLRRFAAHTLLELEPQTGRTHQLRIHCNLIGHPIVGDPIYRSAMPEPDPLVSSHRIKNHLLHASSLIFRHPAGGRELNIEASMPEQMRAVIAAL